MRATCSKGAVAAGRMQNRERVRSIDAREAKQEKKNKRALFFNFLSTCAALAVVKKSSRCWIFIHSRLPAWRNAFKERERRRTKKSLVKEKNEELSNLCDTPKRITSPSSSNSLALSPFLSLCDANERETLLRPERIVEGKTRKNRRKDKKQDTKKRLKRN